jgi:hypothetical protein
MMTTRQAPAAEKQDSGQWSTSARNAQYGSVATRLRPVFRFLPWGPHKDERTTGRRAGLGRLATVLLSVAAIGQIVVKGDSGLWVRGSLWRECAHYSSSPPMRLFSKADV